MSRGLLLSFFRAVRKFLGLREPAEPRAMREDPAQCGMPVTQAWTLGDQQTPGGIYATELEFRFWTIFLTPSNKISAKRYVTRRGRGAPATAAKSLDSASIIITM
jgi:hypothetical protein